MKDMGRNGLSAQSDPSFGRDQPKNLREDIDAAHPQISFIAKNIPVEALEMPSMATRIDPTHSTPGPPRFKIDLAGTDPRRRESGARGLAGGWCATIVRTTPTTHVVVGEDLSPVAFLTLPLKEKRAAGTPGTCARGSK
jgi:hypothetical protein